MAAIVPLENPVQSYAWGSRTAIADLLGVANPSGRPEAELWIGAHPKSPSMVIQGLEKTALGDHIGHDPERILGRRVASRFDGALPFLLKVLAAEQPLSIQCHPSREQARAGFRREDAAGLALDDPRRNYRDQNHKPELICALSTFRALEGFRPLDEITADLEQLRLPQLEDALIAFRSSADLGALFAHVLQTEPSKRRRLVDAAAARAATLTGDSFEWIVKLRRLYPDDIGVLAPVFLNLVELQQDEALFLGAGQLHAYLGGVGIEIMASSDNVIRCGLTAKHVDIPELLRTVRFVPSAPNILRPRRVAPGARVFDTPAPDFLLTIVDLSPEIPHVIADRDAVEVIFVADGQATITGVNDTPVRLAKGRTVLVEASVDAYRIEGSARLYKAGVQIV